MSDKENEINTMNAIVEAIKEEICNEKENARKKSEELERVLLEQSTLQNACAEKDKELIALQGSLKEKEEELSVCKKALEEKTVSLQRAQEESSDRKGEKEALEKERRDCERVVEAKEKEIAEMKEKEAFLQQALKEKEGE